MSDGFHASGVSEPKKTGFWLENPRGLRAFADPDYTDERRLYERGDDLSVTLLQGYRPKRRRYSKEVMNALTISAC